MANYYTDHPEIEFHLNHPLMKRVVDLKERNYAEKDQFEDAPVNYEDSKLVFTADSDALIVKGIIALLIRVLSGHTPTEIMDADLYFVEKIGLKDHLSPTRSNGLLAMIKQIRMYALAYKTKEAEA